MLRDLADPEPDGDDDEVQADQDGRQEQAERTEHAEQQRVLEDRGDHCGEERLRDGIERSAAERACEDQAGRELEGGGPEDEEGGRKGDRELAQDARERRVDVEPEELGGLEHDQPEQER